MQVSRGKKLIRNIGVFAIGNLGSKIISFALIPILTRYMTTQQYGSVDLIITTVNMLLPIVALSIADAIFRYVMDNDADIIELFSTSFNFTIFMILVMFISLPILKGLKVDYYPYLLTYLALGLIQILFQNFIRGIGYVRLFSANGLISAIILAFVGIYEVVFLRRGVFGYLNALILSTLISVIFMAFFSKIWNFYSIHRFEKNTLKMLLRYSIPLIPNAFLWFFTNDASRFFIVGFLGLAANGLYALATKIPTIINVFYTIFAQAWQISAVEEFEKSDRDVFYTNIFNANIGLSMILIGAVVIVIKPVMSIFAGQSYFKAWEIVPTLLVASFFSNLSSFLGTIYLASKKTKGVLKTTIVGMITNILLNCLLIPSFGLQGAGCGAALGFAFIAFIRLYDTRMIVKIKVNWIQLVLSLILILLMVLVQFNMNQNLIFGYFILVVLEIIIALLSIKSLFNARRN